MKIKKSLTYLALAGVILVSSYPIKAHANDDKWMVRFRAVKVDPDVDSKNKADSSNAKAKINADFIPELDISYFFTKNIATELVLGTSRHNVSALGSADLGQVSLLPPTLTLQYHFNAEKAFKPYVGAGLNYTIFYNQKASNDTYYDTNYQNSLGYALQIGFDYMLDDKFGVNIDVKKIYLSTDISVNHDAVRAKVDIDPWLLGVGAVYKF